MGRAAGNEGTFPVEPDEVERVLAPLYERARRRCKGKNISHWEDRAAAIDALGNAALNAARRTGLPFADCLQALRQRRRQNAWREKALYPLAVSFFLLIALSPILLAVCIGIANLCYACGAGSSG